MGGGSNLLVGDGGIETVISMEMFTGMAVMRRGADILLKAGAGCPFTGLARHAGRQALAGLEFAFGIPGTVGGAVVMNAGAGGGDVKQRLVEVELVLGHMEQRLSAGALGLGYRTSRLPEGAVVVSATFRLDAGNREAMLEKMKAGLAARKASQPLEFPSAGSVFKNPSGDFAGRLIESCGLKGAREGDAEVSVRHANFIVNRGKATASQVLRLIERVEAAVLGDAGVRLEREVRLAGDFI